MSDATKTNTNAPAARPTRRRARRGQQQTPAPETAPPVPFVPPPGDAVEPAVDAPVALLEAATQSPAARLTYLQLGMTDALLLATAARDPRSAVPILAAFRLSATHFSDRALGLMLTCVQVAGGSKKPPTIEQLQFSMTVVASIIGAWNENESPAALMDDGRWGPHSLPALFARVARFDAPTLQRLCETHVRQVAELELAAATAAIAAGQSTQQPMRLSQALAPAPTAAIRRFDC